MKMAEGNLHKELKSLAYLYARNKGYWVANTEVRGGYYGIYDVWGINPYTFETIGIEIKTSRADWRAAKHKEHKVKNGWCSTNENYICCPTGLIGKDEVEKSFGLLWHDGTRFRNIKKPIRIKVIIGEKLKSLIWSFVKWE
jgi:hypothetical protein